MSEATRLTNEITDVIREIFGAGQIPLHAPTFSGNEWDYLKDCLDSTFVSSVGKFVEQFEQQLVDFTGSKYAVSVVNGTAALQIALMLAGVEKDDEVVISPLTFVATANAISYCNAIPHFADCDPATLGIDPIKLQKYLSSVTSQISGNCVNNQTGRRIRALVPMHAFGHPSDLESLALVAKEFNLVLVEDAAESLGSYRNEKHTGTFGLLGTLSFNGNKTITTGGGGAILTNDENLAKRAKHLTTTAKLTHLWEYKHDEVGYNFRMPNLNAALGCAQLEQLPIKLKSKRELFQRYQHAFADVSGLTLFSEPKNSQSNYWLQTILLDENYCKYRDDILDATNRAGVTTRPAWELMHTLEPFKMSPRMNLDVAESLSKRIINIPSNLGMI